MRDLFTVGLAKVGLRKGMSIRPFVSVQPVYVTCGESGNCLVCNFSKNIPIISIFVGDINLP